MPGRWRRAWPISLAVAAALSACGGDESSCPPRVLDSDADCATTQDCVDAGFLTLQCVSGTCRRPCVSDGDCALETSGECRAEQGPPPPAVCVDQLCRVACPDAPCPGGQVCHEGRCAVAFEDFEARPGGERDPLLASGWNALPAGERLENRTQRIVEAGSPGCPLGTEFCAGPAASGQRFALLGRRPARPRGLPELGPTCRPCACCLACQIEPYEMSVAPASCPVGASPPAPLACPASVPAPCAEVCAACERCPSADAGRGSDASLLPCEAAAAARSCPSCPGCDAAACRACRVGPCQAACEDGIATEACERCEATQCPGCSTCRDCEVCGEALACAQEDPDANACRRRINACAALGPDGCFPTPLRYRRSELTPLEQSLVSPEIDLAGQSGQLVVSFAYVPFGVGRTYVERQEGVPPDMWPEVAQEVVVELCGGGCEAEDAWREGQSSLGGRAAFPPEDRRDEGLSLGGQSILDWRTGRVEVAIPAELRTATFRFRFRPRLAPSARVGIDDVRVRRRRR